MGTITKASGPDWGCNAEGGMVNIVIPKKVLNAFAAHSSSNGKLETGGLLAGSIKVRTSLGLVTLYYIITLVYASNSIIYQALTSKSGR